jgi:hypothetical protein
MTETLEGQRARKWQKAIVALLIVIPFFLITAYFLQLMWVYEIFNFGVDKLHDDLGLNEHLSRAIVAALWVPFLYFVREAFALFQRKRRMLGLAGIAAYIVAYSLLGWVVSRDTYFDRKTGEVERWYALTPEGYRFYDEPGADKTYGIPLRPVTKEIVEAARGKGAAITAYESLDEAPYLFDPVTGAPQVWYGGDPGGEIRFYSRPGFDPKTGEELEPATSDVLRVYYAARDSRAGKSRLRAEQQRATETRNATERWEREFRNKYTQQDAIAGLARSTEWVLVVMRGDGDARVLESHLVKILRKHGASARAGIMRTTVFEPDMFLKLSQGEAVTFERSDSPG